MCRSIVDMQSAATEIRLGIKKKERKKERRKKERRKKETTGQKYNGLLYSIGRP